MFRHVFPIGVRGMQERHRETLAEEQSLHGDLAFIEDLQEDYSK